MAATISTVPIVSLGNGLFGPMQVPATPVVIFDLLGNSVSLSGGSSSSSSPAGAALDGTDANGVTAPAGAVGIRGWLSSSYAVQQSVLSALGSTLKVNVQNASLTASGTVGLAAGTTVGLASGTTIALGTGTASIGTVSLAAGATVTLGGGNAAIGSVSLAAGTAVGLSSGATVIAVPPAGPGTDASVGTPAIGSLLATFTVLTPGAYFVQNQSAATLQVVFDNGSGTASIQLLAPGNGAGQQGGDTSPPMRWFTGRIRVCGPAGSQFMARSN